MSNTVIKKNFPTRLLDNQELELGNSADSSMVHDGTNTVITQAVGNLVIDNTLGTGKIIARLGTDTSATAFEVRNNSDAAIFSVNGAGAVGLPGDVLISDSGTIGLSGSSGSTLTLTVDSVNAGAGEGRTVLAADDQINIDDGTANIQMDGGVITMTGVSSVAVSASGAITAESSAGPISIGANAVAQPVNIATGAAARVISIGNAASASLALEGGVGALSATSDVSLDVNAPMIDLSTQATEISLIDNSGVALAIKEASVNYLIISTANGSEKIQLVQNVEMGQIGEVVTGGGISLASGVEIIGVSKVVSAAVAYNTADAAIFAVPAGEVWLIEDMWFQAAVSWDGNGAFIVGDATDADGFLTLANASLLTTYDESGGIAGWPTGSRGLDSANRGVYLTTAVTLNKRMLRKAGAYNILLDNTPGTSTVGSGTLYMRYTRIS